MAISQIVIFEIDGSEYGIDALAVNGILRAQKYKVQKVPGLPNIVEGMINLRGQVNYIYNLRNKFGLPEMPDKEENKFIMLNVDDHVVGCIVDEVTDIVHFNEEELQAAPAIASSLNVSYIKGIAKVEERMIIMLDPVRLLTAEDAAAEIPLLKLSDLAQ